jgi:hypothetical protein
VGRGARVARGGGARLRARSEPDRGACGPLADRRAAAAARRELAARPHCDVLLWRNGVLSSTCNMVAAGRCWCLSVMNSSIMFHLAQAGSLDVLVFVGEVGVQAGLHTSCILLHEEITGVLGLQSCPACSACGERPPRDISFGVPDRRRRLRVAGVSGAGRRAVLPLLCCWPSGARAAPGSSLVVAS